jgi:hypothetical protein
MPKNGLQEMKKTPAIFRYKLGLKGVSDEAMTI